MPPGGGGGGRNAQAGFEADRSTWGGDLGDDITMQRGRDHHRTWAARERTK
jgi:hypothetical protein